MTLPLVDLRASYFSHREEIDEAVQETTLASDFILGRAAEEFEHAFARFCGVSHAIGCANGTDALELAFECAGIGRGDEVITVSHTFFATVGAILRVGATPVLVDVDPATLLLDGSKLTDAITPRTAAIVVVHLYGSCVPMARVLELASVHGLLVFEDSAQAHGATWKGNRAGSVGDLGTFSFYPSKNLGAFGDAGMVVTNHDDLADRVRGLRDHGKSGKYTHTEVGRNSRLDGVQAAVLAVKLQYLDENNAARRAVYDRYVEAFFDLPIDVVQVPQDGESVHHLFVVMARNRAELISSLAAKGIQTGVHYPVPVHNQPALTNGGRRALVPAVLETTERVSELIVSLPMYPEIRPDQQDSVIDAVECAVSELST